MSSFEIVKDVISDRIDELADLGTIWNKHREAGRTPHSIRQAMIMLSAEIQLMVDMEENNALGLNRNTSS